MKFYTSVESFGNNILLRGYDDGKIIKEKIKYQPTLFIKSNKESKFKTLYDESVSPVKQASIKDAREFMEKYSIDNFSVYGNDDYPACFISDNFGMDIDYDHTVINVGYIDIEVDSSNGFPKPEYAASKVTAITYKNNQDNIYYVWGYGDYDTKDNKLHDKTKTIHYQKCYSEVELLTSFLNHWMTNYPDTISGWNSKGFDIPYLINRVENILGEDETVKFSPWKIKPREKNGFSYEYEIKGVSQLDYLELYKKFSFENVESYRLDFIGEHEVGQKKLDYSKWGTLHSFYEGDFQNYINYNICDVELVERIDEKTKFIELAFKLAYKAGVNYDKVFGTVSIWDTFIFNVLRKDNIVLSPKKTNNHNTSIVGGYVKPPIPDVYEWVVSFDLDSLYPRIIEQYNMSPETIVQDVMDDISVNYLLEKDPKDIPDDMALSASGQLFSKKKRGVFPIIIDKMYAERKETKQRMLKVKAQKEKLPKSEKKEHYELEKLISQLDSNQLAIKILMNGLYGAMTNAWFRYYDPRIGEAITMTGQLTVRLAEQRVNEKLNSILEPKDDYIIAIDTDSIYLNVGKVLSRIKPPTDNYEFCKEFSEKTITPMLKECFVELCNIMHGYENKMNMKLEKISNKAIWVAKKRYVLNVLYNEGVEYDKPKISVTGLDSKKSSTPKVCRTLIEKTLTMILNEDEKTVQAFVKEAKQNFRSLSPEMVASPRSVSDVDKYMSGNTYIKGTPINARGAILYNQLLKDKNVDKIYETIKNGDKIKYIYLKLPNKIKENVIAFKEDMPKEFELHDYIDYDLQFYKSYERPIEQILNAIGWQIKKKGSLRDRF